MNSQNNVDNEVIAEEENNTKKTTQRKSTKRTEKKLLATLYEVNPKTKRKVEVEALLFLLHSCRRTFLS